jgi:hypothetical protein
VRAGNAKQRGRPPRKNFVRVGVFKVSRNKLGKPFGIGPGMLGGIGQHIGKWGVVHGVSSGGFLVSVLCKNGYGKGKMGTRILGLPVL